MLNYQRVIPFDHLCLMCFFPIWIKSARKLPDLEIVGLGIFLDDPCAYYIGIIFLSYPKCYYIHYPNDSNHWVGITCFFFKSHANGSQVARNTDG